MSETVASQFSQVNYTDLTSLHAAYEAKLLGTANEEQLALVERQSYNSDFVVVDIVSNTGDGADLLWQLRALGLTNEASFGAYASGVLPISAIPQLEALGGVQTARISVFQSSSQGIVENEAVQTLNVDDVRDAFGIDGTGVTVGVLSDSFDTSFAFGGGTRYADDIASGDLPDDILVIEDFIEGFGIDEGRAMFQLIHDIAPGADLQFSSAFLGIANFAQSILDLRAAGSDIIVDDIIYFAEPIYSDGVIAQAVDEAVDDGALYFSSAGNGGRLAYRSDFRDGGQTDVFGDGSLTGILHDFDPDPNSTVTFQTLTIGGGGSGFTGSFQWDDPFFSDTGGQNASDTNIDIVYRLLNADGTLGDVLFTVEGNEVGGDPVILSGLNNGGPTAQVAIQFLLTDQPGGNNAPSQIGYNLFDTGFVSIDTFNTGGPTVYGHAAARGSIAVGASAFFLNDAEAFEDLFGSPPDPDNNQFTPALNFFSSFGPTEIFFDADGNRLDEPDVRNTPQITAPDGTSTTVPGFEMFFGTSAAAPNAAAVAALGLEAFPGLSRTIILTALEETSVDITFREDFLVGGPLGPDDEFLSSGSDSASGSGLIQADLFVEFLESIDNARGGVQEGDDSDEVLIGGVLEDAIFGSFGDDRVVANGGNDTVAGNEGDDILQGNGGRDLVSGGSGDDRVRGGGGGDTVRGGVGDDTVQGQGGRDIVMGGEGDDFVSGDNGNDIVDAGFGDDTARGGNGNDDLILSNGDDDGNGGNGNDFISGGLGSDSLNGGNGADALVAGENGNDVLTGGNGPDDFIFEQNFGLDFDEERVVTDFDPNADTLVFDGFFFEFDTAAQILATAVQDGADTVLTPDGFLNQTIRLLDTALASLSGDNVVVTDEAEIEEIAEMAAAAAGDNADGTNRFAASLEARGLEASNNGVNSFGAVGLNKADVTLDYNAFRATNDLSALVDLAAEADLGSSLFNEGRVGFFISEGDFLF